MTEAQRLALIDAYPRLVGASRGIARRYPEHTRDEIRSELLVSMTVIAGKWDPARGIPFLAFVYPRMMWAAAEFSRTQENWSRYLNRPTFLISEDYPLEKLPDPAPEPQARVESLELAAAIVAALPLRELHAIQGGLEDASAPSRMRARARARWRLRVDPTVRAILAA